MLYKKDIFVLQPLSTNVFYKNYVAQFKKIFYELRMMKKSQIVNLGIQDIVMYEKKRPRHRYLVNTVSTLQDYDTLYHLTDLPRCGYLFYYLRKYKTFTKKISTYFTAQILLAIQYLHSKNFLYRLLSPDSIMITEKGNVKLRFDFCNMLGLTEDDYKRNIEYIPVDFYKEGISKASDYWSIGVILFEMLNGYSPFKEESFEKSLCAVKSKRVEISGDEDTRNLIKGLLERHSFKRIGYKNKDEKRIRKMPFFKNIDWDALENGEIESPFMGYKPVNFNEKGKTLHESFQTDMNKREGDGYGSTFYGYDIIDSDISYYMDLN
ncbi:cytochrome c oxidase subunit 1 [Gurleya vavrai]